MRVCCHALLGSAIVLLISGSQAQTGAAPLRPYATCRFADDLAIVQKSPTPPAAAGRTAITLTGPKQVPITRGERLLFAYPGKSPFARVLVEQLPAKSFGEGKADLVSAFDKLIAGDDSVQRNYLLKPQINGFEAHGLDRKELGGAVVGIYLLIDDASHTVISVDFPNQPVSERSFSSIEEYAKLRDGFLAHYSSCIRASLHASAIAKPVVKASAKETKPSRKK